MEHAFVHQGKRRSRLVAALHLGVVLVVGCIIGRASLELYQLRIQLRICSYHLRAHQLSLALEAVCRNGDSRDRTGPHATGAVASSTSAGVAASGSRESDRRGLWVEGRLQEVVTCIEPGEALLQRLPGPAVRLVSVAGETWTTREMVERISHSEARPAGVLQALAGSNSEYLFCKQLELPRRCGGLGSVYYFHRAHLPPLLAPSDPFAQYGLLMSMVGLLVIARRLTRRRQAMVLGGVRRTSRPGPAFNR